MACLAKCNARAACYDAAEPTVLRLVASSKPMPATAKLLRNGKDSDVLHD